MTTSATTEDRTWHPAVVPRTRSLAAVRQAAMGWQACEAFDAFAADLRFAAAP